MKLEATRIPNIVEATYFKGTPQNSIVSTLLTDSRDLTNPADTVFFALKTQANNGHNYILDLHSKGVRIFVADEPLDHPAALDDSMYIKVDSVLDALQAMGSYAREQSNATVIGITGSRGKTVLKENLYAILRDKTNVVRSPRSYNSQIGVPLSLWQMDKDTEVAIIEAGI